MKADRSPWFRLTFEPPRALRRADAGSPRNEKTLAPAWPKRGVPTSTLNTTVDMYFFKRTSSVVQNRLQSYCFFLTYARILQEKCKKSAFTKDEDIIIPVIVLKIVKITPNSLIIGKNQHFCLLNSKKSSTFAPKLVVIVPPFMVAIDANYAKNNAKRCTLDNLLVQIE